MARVGEIGSLDFKASVENGWRCLEVLLLPYSIAMQALSWLTNATPRDTIRS
jgi:hypothetical protein